MLVKAQKLSSNQEATVSGKWTECCLPWTEGWIASNVHSEPEQVRQFNANHI